MSKAHKIIISQLVPQAFSLQVPYHPQYHFPAKLYAPLKHWLLIYLNKKKLTTFNYPCCVLISTLDKAVKKEVMMNFTHLVQNLFKPPLVKLSIDYITIK